MPRNDITISPAGTTQEEIAVIDRLFRAALKAFKLEETAGRLLECRLGFDPNALGAKLILLKTIEGKALDVRIVRAEPREAA